MELNKTVEVLDNIPFKLDAPKIMKFLRPHGESRRLEEIVRELIRITNPVAKPKAVYKVGRVTGKTSHSVQVDGTTFTSDVLRINLSEVDMVFPFIATCGQEVDAIEIPSSEVLKRYCMDVLKMTLAISASIYLQDVLTKLYCPGKLTSMNPGELETWPITQLKEIFSVIGDVEKLIGVRLTESYTMVPLKSRAGIFFATESNFESCQLCLQKSCPGRKVAYNPELEREYRDKAKALAG